ncbi:MAG: BrnT family toxin [Acidobacteria bacterium]|nr:BrnT family toxin [Acidobacteriota bacterium]
MATWDESKRQRNIKIHGMDFEEADAIWDNFTVTREDIREDYGEKRMVTFGILNGEVVVLVHTDRKNDMHVISLRKAEKYEARYYFKIVQENIDKED